MRYFGPRWDAPVCDDGIHVATPLGHSCQMCEKPIVQGDQGVILAHLLPGTYWDDFPVHLDCLVTSVTGKENDEKDHA